MGRTQLQRESVHARIYRHDDREIGLEGVLAGVIADGLVEVAPAARRGHDGPASEMVSS